MSITERIDGYQQRHRKLGIGLATFKKFSEDGSSNLASMIAFWAFFSVFPLFLVAVTVISFVFSGHQKDEILRNIGELFPLLHVKSTGGLTGSWWAVILGGATALWSGLAVVKTTQVAFNSVWEIPEKDRPGLLERMLRGVIALATIGVGLIVATLVSGFVTGDQSAVTLHWYTRLAGYAISLVLDIGLFVLAFRILTSRDVTFRDVLPGAILSGAVFWILQQVSSLIISRKLNGSQGTYGNFATVITILWWFYLQAQITLLGAQLNVVLQERLHPRSLFGGPETEADERTLKAYGKERQYVEEEDVDVDVQLENEQESSTASR